MQRGQNFTPDHFYKIQRVFRDVWPEGSGELAQRTSRMEVLGSIMHEWRAWRWVQVLVQAKRHRLIIWGGVGCFLVLSLLAMAGDRGFLELNEFNRHLQRLEDQIRALEEENLQVRRQVIGLKSDPYQIERVAREDLGLARPDELIFVIIDGLDTTP